MKKCILFVMVMTFSLLLLAGCACEHVWQEADCLNPRICTECQETEGAALGHTPGEWNETVDVVACTVLREQYCSVCAELTTSETVPLDSLIGDGLFLFTPNEFMERLTLVAEQHSGAFTYEFMSQGEALQALVDVNGKEAVIQFFHSNTTPLTPDETDTAEVWCVSLGATGESDADFRHYFLMTCDPTLNEDTALDTDVLAITAGVNAMASGELFGYFVQNQLLYESFHISTEDYSMSMVNVYASDFR